MKTAKEIYDNGVKNGYIGKDIKEKVSLANFQIIADLLEADETILLGFSGFLNEGERGKKMGYPYSFAVTNKRLLMGMKIAISKDSQTLLWDYIDHLSFARHKPYTNFGCITIETIKKPYQISISLQPAEAVFQKLNEVFMEIKSANKVSEPAVSDSADELLKFKKLADMGVITQEEFEAKKKQLLGL